MRRGFRWHGNSCWQVGELNTLSANHGHDKSQLEREKRETPIFLLPNWTFAFLFFLHNCDILPNFMSISTQPSDDLNPELFSKKQKTKNKKKNLNRPLTVADLSCLFCYYRLFFFQNLSHKRRHFFIYNINSPSGPFRVVKTSTANLRSIFISQKLFDELWNPVSILKNY